MLTATVGDWHRQHHILRGRMSYGHTRLLDLAKHDVDRRPFNCTLPQ